MTTATSPAGQLAPSLAAACRRWGDRPAITLGDRTMSYAELGRGVARLAAAYRRLGIGPGDRVVCQLPNSPEHLMAMNAAWAVGAIHVGTDNDLTGRELGWLAERTEAAALLFSPHPGSPDPLVPVEAVRAAHPHTRLILSGVAAAGPPNHLADSLPPPGSLRTG